MAGFRNSSYKVEVLFLFLALILVAELAYAGDQFTVRGTIKQMGGRPAVGVTVKASQVAISGKTELGVSQTDGAGNYQIRYSYTGNRPGAQRPDIIIEVFDGGGTKIYESATQYNSSNSVVLNATVREIRDSLNLPSTTTSQQAQSPQVGIENRATQAGWNADKCNSNLAKLRKINEGCLQIRFKDQRKACLDRAPSQLPKEFSEFCKDAIDPVQAEFEVKSQQMPAADNSSKTSSKFSAPNDDAAVTAKSAKLREELCAQYLPKFKARIAECAKLRDKHKRQICADRAGEGLPPMFLENCRDLMDPLIAEITQTEN